MDGLEAYEFIERRRDGLDGEQRRLEKESAKRHRVAERVGRLLLDVSIGHV